MRKIGFETTAYRRENYVPALIEQEPAVEAQSTARYASVEEILHERGFEEAIKVLQDYMYSLTHRFGGVPEKEREQKRSEACFEKLRKIKMRYFEPI